MKKIYLPRSESLQNYLSNNPITLYVLCILLHGEFKFYQIFPRVAYLALDKKFSYRQIVKNIRGNSLFPQKNLYPSLEEIKKELGKVLIKLRLIGLIDYQKRKERYSLTDEGRKQAEMFCKKLKIYQP